MPENGLSSGWNDERTDRLKTLWAAGDSCSQIARELGGVSKNGVIGKAHRLGLAMREPRARKSEAPRIHISRANPDDDASIPKAQRKTIMQLGNNHCRYPVGDPGTPGFFFCGANAAGQVYCEAHSARATRRTVRGKYCG